MNTTLFAVSVLLNKRLADNSNGVLLQAFLVRATTVEEAKGTALCQALDENASYGILGAVVLPIPEDTVTTVARDTLAYLRQHCGDNADWPLRILADDPVVAEGLAQRLTFLEQLVTQPQPPAPQDKAA